MGFIQLHDEEVLKLIQLNSPLSWAVYHKIRRYAYVDKWNLERSYWSFPSQKRIGADLGFWAEDHTMTGNNRKKIRECAERLESIGLIRVYRPLSVIEKDRSKDIPAAEKEELKEEWKRSSEVRDQLKKWGKTCGVSVSVYELVFLREIEGVLPSTGGGYVEVSNGGTSSDRKEEETKNKSFHNKNETAGGVCGSTLKKKNSSITDNRINNNSLEDRLILVSGVLLSTSEVVSLTKSKPGDLKLIQRIEDLQYLEEIVSDQVQKIMIEAEIERRELIEEDLRRLLEEPESEEEFKLVFETKSEED